MQTDEHAAMLTYMRPLIEQQSVETPILRQVPVDLLQWAWPLALPHLASVVDRSDGRWTYETIGQALLTGQWQLWLVWSGAVAAVVGTELFHEASGQKSARIVFVAGETARAWVHLVAEIEAWARDQGCLRLEMLARKGWARHLPDYKLTHVLLEKDLRDGV